METWVKNFAHKTGIPIANCVALAHYKTAKPKGNVKPPKGLERVTLNETSLENSSNLQLIFDKLFGIVYSSMVEGQEKAERDITNT